MQFKPENDQIPNDLYQEVWNPGSDVTDTPQQASTEVKPNCGQRGLDEQPRPKRLETVAQYIQTQPVALCYWWRQVAVKFLPALLNGPTVA